MKIKADTKEFWFAVLVTLIGLGAVLPAQTVAAESAAEKQPQRTIVVSLQDRKLALIEDGEVKVVYKVAVGKTSTPSPVGSFTVVNRVANPSYTHDGKFVAAGPGNPVGTRWMGLSQKGYGIHGTNVPSSIGKAASHGCIRLGKKDLEQLFTLVQVGDVVEIHGERDEEVAAVFGGTPASNTVVAEAAPMLAPAQGQE